MPNAYLAAHAARAAEMERYREDVFEPLGITVVSRWHQNFRAVTAEEVSLAGPHARYVAIRDLTDVSEAHMLIMFPGGGYGGRHVETGYALGLRRRVIICGERENVFHAHPSVEVTPNIVTLVGLLRDSGQKGIQP